MKIYGNTKQNCFDHKPALQRGVATLLRRSRSLSYSVNIIHQYFHYLHNILNCKINSTNGGTFSKSLSSSKTHVTKIHVSRGFPKNIRGKLEEHVVKLTLTKSVNLCISYADKISEIVALVPSFLHYEFLFQKITQIHFAFHF